MSFPTVIIYSFTDSLASDLAQEILVKSAVNSDVIHNNSSSDDSIQTFLWQVETKYYTAQVEICAARHNAGQQDQGLINKLNAMEAMILQFDSDDRRSFNAATKLFESLDTCPAVQLLVCRNCSREDSDVQKIEVQEWCIKNGFELVELESNESSEDDFAETTGLKRIIQALHAHTWSNLHLKDKPDSVSGVDCLLQSVSRDETSNMNELLGESMKNVTLEASSDETDKQNSRSFLEDGDFGNASFELLFEKFQSMKDKAKSMPVVERKEYAEQVAIAFWKAIGGDKNEIEDLDGDD